MLYISGLVKSYKNHKVLRDLNMNVHKGDVYGFLGANGCGKTTTMNIICNITTKDAGEINFQNPDIRIGYLPEAPALYGYMNGFEYLNFIGACSRYNEDINTRTAEVLELIGMRESAGRLISGYSRGMIQRMGIASALYANPELLILDEPTSALDPQGRAEVMDTIEMLAATGVTIILCTHILSDVERVANKIGILHNGVMAVEDDAIAMKKRYGDEVSLSIRLGEMRERALAELNALCIVQKGKLEHTGDIILTANAGVSEKELYTKTVMTLADLEMLPERLEFKRLSLEQMYLKVIGGTSMPERSADL